MASKATNEAKIEFNADVRKFNEALSSLGTRVKELKSEFSLLSAQMGSTGDSTEILRQQHENLFRQWQEAGAKVDLLNDKLETAVRHFGENSDEVNRLSAEVNKAEAAQEKLRQQMNSVADALAKQESAYGQLSMKISAQEQELSELKAEYASAVLQYGKNSDEAKALAKQIESLSGELKENKDAAKAADEAADSFDQTLAETKDASEEVQKAIDTLNGYFKSLYSGIDDFVKGAARECIEVISEIGEYVLETGMQTEASFSKVQAVSGATDEELEALKNTAAEVGTVLPVTLNDSATAYYYMALAGWDAEQMQKALYNTQSLVIASGEDLSRVNDIVTDGITAFGMTCDDTTHFVDVMSAAMSNSNTDVDQLGEAYSKCAPNAATLGYTVDDVSFALGLMADNGIKSSQAGTALRNVFLNMTKPTEKAADTMAAYGMSLTDADGNLISFKELLDQTRASFGKIGVEIYDADGNLKDYDTLVKETAQSTDGLIAVQHLQALETIYGKRAVTGMVAILNTEDEAYEALYTAIENCDGITAQMAATMQDNLQGDVDMLNTSLNMLANQLYENASPKLREFVQTLTEWVNSDESVELIDSIAGELTELLKNVLENLPEILNTIGGILQGIPSAINAVSTAIQWVVTHINDIVTAIKAVLIVWAAVKAMSVISTVVSFTSALGSLVLAIGGVTTATGILGTAIQAITGLGVIGIIAAAATGIVALVNHIKNLNDNTEECNTRISALTSAITPFNSAVTSLSPTISNVNELMSATGRTVSDVETDISTAETAITNIIKNALSEQGELRASDLEDIASYNAKIAELEEEKLNIYRQNQSTVLSVLKAQTEMSQAEMAQQLANAKSSLEQVNAQVDTALTARQNRLQQYYEAQGMADSEAHQEAIREAQQWAEQEKAVNQQKYAESLEILTSFATQAVEADMEMWRQTYENSNKGREAYVSNLEQMDLDAAEAFLSMYNTAVKAGVDIPEETTQMAKDILGSFSNLPDACEEQGKDILEGLIAGIKSEIPGLEDTTDMTCDTIVDSLSEGLEINSPSKVTMKTGESVVEGLVVGMKNEGNTLSTAAKSTADTLTKDITPDANKVTGIGSTAMSELTRGIQSQIQSLTRTVQDIASGMVRNITPDSSAVKGVGQDLMTGIDSGMNSKSSWLGSRISSLASGLVNKFKSAFNIGSPSKVMADEVGQWLPAGIGEGIEENAESATNPLRDMIEQMMLPPNTARLKGWTLDVNTRLEDHMQSVGDSAETSLYERMIAAVEALGNAEFALYLDGDRFASATAAAADSISGTRLNIKGRGLALE